MVYGILVPQPGIEPVPPEVEAQCPNHWTTREIPGIAFLRGKCLLISWLPSLSTVILEPKIIKSVTASIFSFLFAVCEMMGQDAMILVFCAEFLSVSSFALIQRLFSSSSLSAIRVVSSAYLRLLIQCFWRFQNSNESPP